MEHGEERGERQPIVCYQATPVGPGARPTWSLELCGAQRDSPTGQGSGVLSQACSSPPAGTYCRRGNVGPEARKNPPSEKHRCG